MLVVHALYFGHSVENEPPVQLMLANRSSPHRLELSSRSRGARQRADDTTMRVLPESLTNVVCKREPLAAQSFTSREPRSFTQASLGLGIPRRCIRFGALSFVIFLTPVPHAVYWWHKHSCRRVPKAGSSLRSQLPPRRAKRWSQRLRQEPAQSSAETRERPH